MFVRRICSGFLAAVLLAGAGCRKESAPTDQQASVASNRNSTLEPNQKSKFKIQNSPPPLLRVHWLGKKRLATETNATALMAIWNLPESARLETQTLDKLALWLSGWRQAASNYQDITNYSVLVATNTTASLLLPLLQDLVQEEWLLELRQPTNQPAEAALAIRLDDQRAGAWQAAQGQVRDSLSTLRRAPCALTLTRSGAWTLLGLARSPGTNSQLSTLSSQLAGAGTPFPPSPTNYWLEANIDLQKLGDSLGGQTAPRGRASPGGRGLPGGRASSRAPSAAAPASAGTTNQITTTGLAGTLALPTVSLTVIGDGENVRTHAEMDFPQPLPLELDAWNIPTNLIHDPLIGFTAIRGLRPFLINCKPWNDLQLGTPPNQAFLWAMAGMPVLEYGAVPLADASNAVQKATARISQAVNPWLATKGMGSLSRATNFNGLVWMGAPFMQPGLRSVVDNSGQFAFVSLIPSAGTNPPPPELLQSVLSRTNLVFYDWELTAPRLDQWLYLGQLFRLIAQRTQMLPHSASLEWTKAAASKLGNCVTVVTGAEPSQLSLVRRSGIGFNAVELHLLADWLESPDFPHGLHSLLAPPPSPSTQSSGASPPASPAK